MAPPQLMGIYPSDSIVDVAQSLPIDPLGAGAADLLAGDVEYRLHLILQEAKKFMVHGKRGVMTPEDVEYAMEALNVEPVLIPPRPLPIPSFQSITVPPTGSSSHPQPLYHTPDEEIDFASYLKQPLPAGLANSAGVKWKAHWLAVEGVQPAIPENPTPGAARAGPSRPQPASTTLRPQARTHLPQELQLYFTRLTTALVPTQTSQPETDTERHRLAALASLREDVAVSGILVYIVKWLAESIQKCLMAPTSTIGYLVDAVEAVLSNEALFVEPYMHQLLPPLLSIILTVPLGPHPPSSSSSSQPSAYDIRLRASEVLGKIVDSYSKSYSGLVPRLVSTLSKALQSPPFPSPLGASFPPAGRYEGAILGLAAVGGPAVRSSVWGKGGEGLVRIDDLAGRLYTEATKRKNPLMKAAVRALNTIIRPKPVDPAFVPPSTSQDDLADNFGPYVARALEKRPWMASELMRIKREGSEEQGSGNGNGDEMEVDEPRR